MSLPCKPGQAAAIMTGAPAPPGADAVVMVEYTSRDAGRVQIMKPVLAGDNIAPVASEAKRGEKLLSPGARLDFAAIAVAASVGRSRLLVYSKPKVAILSTGDEIVDIDVPPAATQIRNSNSYSLAAQVQAAGGEPVLLPIAPDEPERLRELIADGLEADLLLLAGGVSMGKYDLVEQVLAEFQAEFFFTGAQIQPGKPIVFGRVPCGRGRLRPRNAAICPGPRIFLRTPRQSSLHHGDFRTLRPPDPGSTGRHVATQAGISKRPPEVRDKNKNRPEAIPPGNSVWRIRTHRS